MINPYKDVDWQNIVKIPACSHQHCETQAQFDNIVASGMYRLYAISNYYPSEPVYPLSDKFTDIPGDAISCPNAEYHNMSNNGSGFVGLHVNGLGCTKISGSGKHWDSESGSYVFDEPVGFDGLDWRQAFTQILATLLYSDGGGITINHPAWSNRHGGLRQSSIEQMLLFDKRVLGIEIYNAGEEDWDWELWDSLLRKGFKCLGFAASDHTGQNSGSPRGRNVLLCNTADTHECLKAYREGRFYCQRLGSELAFTGIDVSNNVINVSTANANNITIVTNKKTVTVNGNTASVHLPNGSTYVRVEARNTNDNDVIWSQAIMLDRKGGFNKRIPYLD